MACRFLHVISLAWYEAILQKKFGPNNKLLNAHAMSKGTRVKAKKNMEDENEIGSDEIEVDLILSVKLGAK